MAITLGPKIITADDLNRVINEISQLRELTYSAVNMGINEADLVQRVSEATAEVIQLNKEERPWPEVLDWLNVELPKTSVVQIQIPGEISRMLLQEIKDKLTSAISLAFVLNITRDDSLLGGIVLEIDGIHLDFSLERRIKELSDKQLEDLIDKHGSA